MKKIIITLIKYRILELLKIISKQFYFKYFCLALKETHVFPFQE